MAGATAGTQQVVAGAAREERAAPGDVVAGVGDVLAGDPDRVAVDRGRAIVTPAGARRIAHLLLIAGKAVILRRAQAAGDDVPRADADLSVDGGIGRAGVGGVTRGRECHHAAAALGHADGRVGEVVAAGAQIALQGQRARVRVDDEPLDAGALRAAVWVQRRIQRAPQLAIGERHLLHAGVVRVRRRDDFVVRRLAA